MLYTITPKEEKAALNEVLKSMMWHKQLKSLVNQSLLLSDIVLMNEITQREKFDIISNSLYGISFNVLVDNKDFNSNYENCKSLYAKYANQNLFGAISGVSLTSDNLQQLKPEPSNDSWQDEIATSEYEETLIASLFFDYSKNSSEFYRAFDQYLNYNDLTCYFNFLLLLLKGDHFTEERVQKIVSTNQDTGDGGSMIFFAACPYTKHWLTKTNFTEEYKSLMECSMSHGYQKQSITELSIAYQDLFAQDFTNVALEAIKELDNYRDLSREFDSEFNYLNHHQFEIHSELLRLNYTPYSDGHYKYMVSHYRNDSYIHDPSHLTRLAKSPKTKDLIVRKDFKDCLQKLSSYHMENYDLDQLSQAYQDLFGEEFVS